MRAKYKYPDGTEYSGEWSDAGQRHGLGQLQFSDGTRYVGNFKDGFCDGPGIMTFHDGSKYEGEFHLGRFDGFGVFTRQDGMKYEGEFKDGKVWGRGLMTFADGTSGLPRNEGHFESSKFKKQEKSRQMIDRGKTAASKARDQIADVQSVLQTIK